MPGITLRRNTVFAAAGTVRNALAGESPEIVQEDSQITLAAVESVVTALAVMSLRIQDQISLDRAELGIAAVLNEGAKIPDNVVYRGYAAKGDRLILEITAGAAGTVNWLLELTPV